MKKNKRIISALATLALIVIIVCSVFAADRGWVKKTEYGTPYWVYYDNDGTLHKGWLKYGDKWYYLLEENGHMFPDPFSEGALGLEVNGKVYRFNEDGTWINTPGWSRQNKYKEHMPGTWYYIQEDGSTAIGWKKINGNWYYFNDYRACAWVGDGLSVPSSSEGDPGGDMMTGNGIAIRKNRNEFEVTGVYSFGSSGVMKANQWAKYTFFLPLNSYKWMYHGANGKAVKGWQKIDGNWYYFNNNLFMQTGWQKISGKWYYLGTNGIMTTGWQKVSGKWYYMASSGVMQTGWIKLSGKWYYLGSNGAMVTGTQVINGKTYTFSSGGVWIK